MSAQPRAPRVTLLRAYIDSFVEAVEHTRYRELDGFQPAPWASLAHGGGGTAYALQRLGRDKSALRWTSESLADRRTGAYDWDDYGFGGNKHMYGRSGVMWVRSLIAGKTQNDAIAGFCRYARTKAEPEFVGGLSGTLTAAAILYARTGDARVRATGDHAAKRLERSVKRRRKKPWEPIDAVGFAHFWPGILYGLLAWTQVTGAPVPEYLASALRDLVAMWSVDVVRVKHLHGSWCNGLSGVILLWTKAFEATGDQTFRDAALAAGKALPSAQSVGYDLCCGTTGAGWSAMELERIDPGHGWREQAGRYIASAVKEPLFKWPSGLLRGHPGLVCLADDLVADKPRGFPAHVA